jgi:HlyD family secretion protein
MTWFRRILLASLAVAALVLVARAFRPKPIAIEAAAIERGVFVETVDEPGRTRVRERYVVSAPVSGELARIELRPGDAIEAGAVLATIRPATPAILDARTRGELEARVRAAQAAQALATAAEGKARDLEAHAAKEATRIRDLAARGAVAGIELENADHALAVAKSDVRHATLAAKVAAHELEVARATLTGQGRGGEIVRITAPLAGRILKIVREDAGVVQAGTPLVELADPTDLEVVVSVLTADAVNLRPGARSTLDRWGGEPLEGAVRTIEPSGYTKLSALGVEEQRVDVVIDLVSPHERWRALGDGFRVHTKTVVYRKDDALKAAASAIFRDGDGWAAFVIEEGRARKRSLPIERRNGVEVLLAADAIAPGTAIVAYPRNEITEGTRVALR